MAELPTSSAPHVDPPGTPSYKTLTSLAVGVVIVAALYFGRDVLLPFALAVLLSFVLSPVVRALRRVRIPRVIAVVFSVALALAMIGGIGALVATQLVQIADDLPQYQTTIERKVSTVRDLTIGRITELMSRLPGSFSARPAPALPPGRGGPQLEQTPVPVEVRQPPINPLALAERILEPVLHPLATAGIVFVVTIFILLQRDDLRERVIRLCGARDLHRTTLAMDDATHRLSRFFLVQLGINTLFGILVGAGLYFIGLPSPLLWGTIAALMRFVPYIGSYVAAALPILLAAAVDPGWAAALWVAGLFLVTEPVMGQVIEPMLYGRSTGLSPLAVVISAIFWGWLWGPVGLILSTPLTLCLVVLGQHVEQLEFLQVLFGDRPALSKIENFYQRLLAGDSDDLQEQAEDSLKEMSLTSYYDDIALKGLELAAVDLVRGSLGHSQVERIKDVVTILVAELESYNNASSGPNRASIEDNGVKQDPHKPFSQKGMESVQPTSLGGKPIRCVAARGLLDEAAATMLAQILVKHGLSAEVVPAESVSRAGISAFASENVAVICVCYMDSGGSTSHLRFLLRRLRQRVPNARLVVALWPRDHFAVLNEGVRASLGADYYVTSLQEAMNACEMAVRENERRSIFPAEATGSKELSRRSA
jgi:predicted PurR-regulated permease PerM